MKYFGTDGIRGIPNEKLNVNLLTRLGQGLAKLNNNTVSIATDTRISKDMISSCVSGGALSMNLNVKMLGIIPTPALIYYSYINKCTGVMVTASHNPYTDNGLKVLNKGLKLDDSDESIIENIIDKGIDLTTEVGSLSIIDDPLKEYYDLLNKYIIKTNYKIAIDCANGATYKTAPNAFSKVTDNLVVICNSPDGYNINNACGSTHLEMLKKTVVENKCDFGFAFDGDGDRVLAIDSTGDIIDGDMLIYILTCHLKEQQKLNHNKVVLTKMSNLGLINDLNNKGIDTVITDVGDRNVVKAIFDEHLSIGGENSGHIIMPDCLHTGDGVLNALIITGILQEKNKTFKELLKDVIMYPDKTVSIKVKDKNKVLSYIPLQKQADNYKQSLGLNGKIIVRASGTEELIRVTVSARTNEIVDEYLNKLISLVEEAM